MRDLSYWLLTVAQGVTFLAGVVILLRHRRRSRRATTLGLVALSCLAGEWLFWLALSATWEWWESALPDGALHPVQQGLHFLARLWRMACLLLLVWAVVADRRSTPATGAEADYADGGEPRRSAE